MQRNGLKKLNIRKMKKNYVIIVLMVTIGRVQAQNPESGMWIAVQMPVSLSKKLQWHNDAGYRTLGNYVSASQYLYRTGLRYLLNNNWSITAGPAFFYTRTTFEKTNKDFGSEFRLWQELNKVLNLSKNISLQNRFRTEQRWFASTDQSNSFFRLRFRYRVAATKALNENWSFQLANEYMIQHSEKKSSFDQNRLMCSVLFKINKSTQVQSGYMWLKIPKDSRHILTLGIQKSFSLHEN